MRERNGGLKLSLLYVLAVIAWANLAFFLYANQRGILSLQGIGIYSLYVSIPVVALGISGWFYGRSTPNCRLARWLIIAPTLAVAIMVIVLPWKWYV